MSNTTPVFDAGKVFDTIKKLIGFTIDYTAFDVDILISINSVFSILYQLGVISYPIEITNTTTWSELNLETDILSMVKDYIYLKIKLIFDPPQIGSLNASMTERIKELEWRLNIAADPGRENLEDVE